jgi:hypothetical protein
VDNDVSEKHIAFIFRTDIDIVLSVPFLPLKFARCGKEEEVQRIAPE